MDATYPLLIFTRWMDYG